LLGELNRLRDPALAGRPLEPVG